MNTLTRFALIALVGYAALPAAAQSPRVTIREMAGTSFAVAAQGSPGSSPEDAMALAMERACQEGLERGKTHLAVQTAEREVHSYQAQIDPGGREYSRDLDGRVYSTQNRPARSETRSFGSAILLVSLISESSVEDLLSMQIIDSRDCSLVR